MLQGPFRVPSFNGYIPRRLQPWIYLLFAFIFLMSGGIYGGAMSQVMGEYSLMREDVLMIIMFNVACMEMSKVRTGALIVIEQDVQLSEYERTGIFLDSLVSSQLLINIFEHNTPLHDGAVFIRNNRIVAATCYLPLSDNMLLSKELGTRHRAGVGISEVSDSITLIVSEETGMISVAHDGMLFRGLSQEELREQLSTLMKNQDAPKRSRWRRIIKNEKKANG